MSKFSGVIGYQSEIEVSPGVWQTSFIEKSARGDILRKDYRWSSQSFSTIETDSSSEKISIGADRFWIPLIRQNRMKYIKYEGDDTKYSITGASVDRPRIILTVGGIFHEESNGSK